MSDYQQGRWFSPETGSGRPSFKHWRNEGKLFLRTGLGFLIPGALFPLQHLWIDVVVPFYYNIVLPSALCVVLFKIIFVHCLKTLLGKHWVIGWVIGDEMERIWKDADMAWLRYFPGETKENHANTRSKESVFWLRFELIISWIQVYLQSTSILCLQHLLFGSLWCLEPEDHSMN